MIGVKDDRHNGSTFDFATADEATEAGDLSEDRIPSKIPDNLPIPRLRPLSHEGGLEFRKLFLNAGQAFFELEGFTDHTAQDDGDKGKGDVP